MHTVLLERTGCIQTSAHLRSVYSLETSPEVIAYHAQHRTLDIVGCSDFYAMRCHPQIGCKIEKSDSVKCRYKNEEN